MTPSISIIIVNYNSKDLLLACLESILHNIFVKYEVVVVDNASTDDSYLKAKNAINDQRFKFVESDKNLGFAKANNLGYRYSVGNILHFLNPDTLLSPALNKEYEQIVKKPSNVYVSPLINPDGSIANSRNVIPTISNEIYRLIFKSKVKYWYIGASVIISKENFEKIHYWTEDYFMYSEDLDLFYKINRHSIPVRILNAQIIHLGGGCSSSVWASLEREIYIEKSYKKFFKINRSIIEYYLIKILELIYLLIISPNKAYFKFKAFYKANFCDK